MNRSKILFVRLSNWRRFCSSECENRVIPSEADAVICGGSLIGLSTALHLARRGFKNVLLLEQNRIGQGSGCYSYASPHHLWQDLQLFEIAQYSIDFYKELQLSYPNIDLQQCGSIFLAQKASTFDAFKRLHSLAGGLGVKSYLVSPAYIASSMDIKTSDLKGGIHFLDDARLKPTELCKAVAGTAVTEGVKILEEIQVTSVLIDPHKNVYGVETELGLVKTNTFVDTAGVWAGRVPLKGYPDERLPKLPLQPCSHEYIRAKPNSNTFLDTPYILDIDGRVYLSGSGGQVTAGGFIFESMTPKFMNMAPPRNFKGEVGGADWDAFQPALEHLVERFPKLEEATVEMLFSKIDNYTPDGYPLVGAVPSLNGYFVGGGMNGFGSSLSGGLGKLLAEWVATRNNYNLSQDVSKIDVARLLDLHSNAQYLKERAPEIAGFSFYPFFESGNICRSARNLRMSPIFHNLKEEGAVFGVIMGYERALYFDVDNMGKDLKMEEEPLVGKPNWFIHVAKEYEACRERVAVIDMSHFSKFDIVGPSEKDVVEFLQLVCSTDIDKPVGTTVYTGMQNDNGGYITDCTLSRLAANHYFMIAPTVQQVRCKVWLEKHINPQSGVIVQDVTSTYTALNVLGPLSRHLLQDLTGVSMTATDFPAFRCKVIDVGFASGVRAVSVSHCGELGWVLYIPNEFSQHVYGGIVETGKSYGLKHAGYLTLRQLRMEKFYVYWGQDIDLTTTPSQCGRDFRVDLRKGNFIGKKAIMREAAQGSTRKYVQLLLNEHNLHTDPWARGQEPIYRNGVFCGLTTSAGYGFTLGCQLCIGYIENFQEDNKRGIVTSAFILDPEACYEVEVCGKRFSVRINLHSPQLSMVSSEQPSHYRPTQ